MPTRSMNATFLTAFRASRFSDGGGLTSMDGLGVEKYSPLSGAACAAVKRSSRIGPPPTDEAPTQRGDPDP